VPDGTHIDDKSSIYNINNMKAIITILIAIGRSTDPLNFTSTDFKYNVSPGKKGGWVIEIKPKDAGDVRELNLNISSSGYGTLYVNQQNRQAISYSGKVEPLKKKA
jgi:hypothetical protein